MKRCLLLVFAALLLVFSVANLLAPDYDAGEYMLYGLAVGVGAYAAFFKRAEKLFQRRGFRAVRWAARCVLMLFACVIVFLAVMGNTDTATGGERMTIVLGAPLDGEKPCEILRERLKKTADFLRVHAAMPAVLSGGQVPGETIPEADAMYAYLTKAGIPGAQLTTETKSQTTKENFLFSLALMEQSGMSGETPIVIVTNSFHCYRARRYAENVGFLDINILPCYTDWSDCPTWYLREVVATLHFWVTDR